MIAEIVLPNDNEEEFIEIASKLSIKKLFLLYDFDKYDEEKIQKKLNSVKNKKVNVETGFIVNQKNMKKASDRFRLLVVKSSDKDRFFLESKKIKVIYGLEEIHKKDYIHHRASGLNHTICEIARQNNAAIGFSYSSLLNKPSQTASLIIGRIIQNIRLCNKYNVKTIVGSFSGSPLELRAPHDVAALFKIFGMHEE